ncbi:MAG: 1-acyl-sn-glycerol-3-phosphate acyltransferase [Cocleimonas sp.]|jgi:1-acyl-sn-glycerol-3-phosphate acyltransferase
MVNLFNTFILYARSTLFWIGFAVSIIFVGLLTPFLFPLPYKTCYRILLPWTNFNVWWLKLTCGVKYKVIGKENIDLNNRGIILGNHQSTWETMAIPMIFPPISWVLKQELFKLPLFGWALSQIKPIAIDRKAGNSAVEQIKEKGKERLDQGNWVCIFPEGTRLKPGTKGRYRMGGALLAQHTGYPVYPVAHNAGVFWPKHSYIKYPGTITLVIGKPFSVKGLKPDKINDKVKAWIETETKKMPLDRK